MECGVEDLMLAAFEMFRIIEQRARRTGIPAVSIIREALGAFEIVQNDEIPHDIIPGSFGALFDATFELRRTLLRLVLSEIESRAGGDEIDDDLVSACVARTKERVLRLSHNIAVTKEGVVSLSE